jgi:hypothetical protein
MTAITVASFLQGASHPAHGDRRFLMSLASARGGVIPKTATFTDLKVSQRGAGANMSVDVAEGSCFVTGTESTYQGIYHGENQGVQNVTLTAANVTNARRDLIVARIKDVEYGVAVTNAFTVEKIDGTPAGSPVDPTVPDNCIVLARVAVAANASSITNANITDLRTNYTAVTGASVIGNQVKSVATGGITPCLSAFRPTKGLFEGEVIYETDTKQFYTYNGSGWTLNATRPMTTLGDGRIVPLYSFRVWRNAAHSLSAATFNVIFYDTDDWDPSGVYSEAGRFVPPVTGLYHWSAAVCGSVSSGIANRFALALFVDNVERERTDDINNNYTPGAWVWALSGSGIQTFTAGQLVDIRLFSSNAASIDVSASQTRNWFSAYLI